jgi:hypothetical protein
MTFFAFQLIPPEVAGSLSWAEKLETILTTAIGGYVLVFIVLALIWGILELFHFAFVGKKEAAPSPQPKPSVEPVPVIEEAPQTFAPAIDNEEEIVAAIMAAISAYTDKPTSSFRVVSFRKKS